MCHCWQVPKNRRSLKILTDRFLRIVLLLCCEHLLNNFSIRRCRRRTSSSAHTYRLLVVKEPGNSVCRQPPQGTCRLPRSVVFVSSREARVCGICCFASTVFFRFASKKPDQHAAFFRPRRAVPQREANYSKRRFWSARGWTYIFFIGLHLFVHSSGLPRLKPSELSRSSRNFPPAGE